MNILAIETTGKYGSAAVINDSGMIRSAESREEMNHLKGIISVIDDALRSAGITKDDLSCIAASVGPGSFTGIRIGVTTARTMAQMLGIPCIAVSTLEALASGALSKAIASGADYVVPVINARRHQTYSGVYRAAFTSDYEMQLLVPELEEKQYMIEELLDAVRDFQGAVMFTGDGIDAYGDIIRDALPDGSYMFADEDIRYQHAEAVARIALSRAGAGETISYEKLLPEYMRLAEAEQKLRAGTLSDRIKNPG